MTCMLARILFFVLDLLEILGDHNTVDEVGEEESDLNHVENRVATQETLINNLCLAS